MKRILFSFVTILILSFSFSNYYQDPLTEEEMSKIVGKGPGYRFCWSYSCQPWFPGQGNCPDWTGPGVDTEHICDHCTGDPEYIGKICKPTKEKIICTVYGRNNICGQLQKGICVSVFDEESGYYTSHCDFAGEDETYGMCKWGWEHCIDMIVP